MRINFRQGIVTYPSSGNAQTFLAKSGSYINLSVSSVPVLLAFAHRDADYLVTESVNVNNAWGPLSNGVDYWLYWDINMKTGIRTFGFTTVAPVYSPTQVAGVPDQHWFNTTTGIMYVFTNNMYRECIRLFAAKFNTTTFYPLGVGFPSLPYAGSQVGLTTQTAAGQIITDSTGAPIRQGNGTFFTTETDFFVDGSVINPVRIDATVVTGQALETMAKFNVVKFSDFGKLNIATYDDLQSSTIAMLLDDLVWQEVGTVCLQGLIVNPVWNWTTVGAPLWVANNGVLTDVDPHVSNALTYPTSKAPIARVVTQTSIIFDQGLGGKGDRGEPGLSGGVALADATTIGVAQLSVNPQDSNVPIAVGTNDPRLNSVPTAGGTMTGLLILSGVPVATNGAATKQYVDTAISSISVDTSTLVLKAGDTMSGLLVLSGDPSAALGASTKQYTDAQRDAAKAYSDTSIANIFTRSNTFTKPQSVAPVALADASTISTDASLSNSFFTILGGNRMLANPTNMTNGQIINFLLKQDSTGSRTLTFDTKFDFGAAGAPTLTTTAFGRDFMSCYYDGLDDLLICTFRGGN